MPGDWPEGRLEKAEVGPISALPNAADELAKAVDAIQAAEGALCRAQAILTDEHQAASLERERAGLARHRQRILAIRGGPKAEPSHWLP